MPHVNARPGTFPADFFAAVAHAAGHARGGPPSDDAPARNAPSIAQVVDRVFDRYDADDNAAISLAEVLAVVDPDGTRSEAAAAATAAVDTLDSNDNGALSDSEVTDAVAAADSDGDGLLEHADHAAADGAVDDDVALAVLLRGGHPGGRGDRPGGDGTGHDRPTTAEAVAAIFERYDADAGGTVTLAEVLAVLDPDGDRAALSERLAAQLTSLDSNADGGLSAAELIDAAPVPLIGILRHGAHGHGGHGAADGDAAHASWGA